MLAAVGCRVENLEVGQAVVRFISAEMVNVVWWRGKCSAEVRSSVESYLPMKINGCGEDAAFGELPVAGGVTECEGLPTE